MHCAVHALTRLPSFQQTMVAELRCGLIELLVGYESSREPARQGKRTVPSLTFKYRKRHSGPAYPHIDMRDTDANYQWMVWNEGPCGVKFPPATK